MGAKKDRTRDNPRNKKLTPQQKKEGYEIVDCPTCGGSGKRGIRTCPLCGGDGKIRAAK